MDDDVTGGPLGGEDAPDSSEGASDEATGLDRRNLLRKSVIGAGVAGLVWSAPRIDGLSVRPDYAAAATGGNTDPSQPFDQTFPLGPDGTPGPYSEPATASPTSPTASAGTPPAVLASPTSPSPPRRTAR